MAYNIQQLNDCLTPTIMATLEAPFSVLTDIAPFINELNDRLAATEGERVYIILDPSGITMNLGEIVHALGMVFLPHDDLQTEHVLSDRVTGIWIGSGMVFKVAAAATNQDQYGNRRTELFPTVDAALAYINEQSLAHKA